MMRETGHFRAFHRLLALSLVLATGGGCFVLGYDFDKEPPAVCKTAADCPGDEACGTPACEAGVCKVLNPVAKDVAPPGQAIGDCKHLTCDGSGNANVAADDADLPEDGNECTEDSCAQGTPKNTPSGSDKPCGVGGALLCNGVGVCAGCSADAQCGVDTECVKWTCDQGSCVRNLMPVGTLATNPLPGDCKANLCAADGSAVESLYQNDPLEDGDECTVGVCNPDGTTTQNAAPDGTSCGGMTPCKACTAGVCGDCAGDFYCNMTTCSPLKKLPLGAACTQAIDCELGNCVDGVCCDGPCGGTCKACSNAKTGKPNGVCSTVPDGSDPNDSCQTPAADVCVGGTCQCFNGVKDGGELKVDCGGNCTPCPGKWVCDGANGCTGAPPTICCDPVCGIACGGGENACNAIAGTTCQVGEADKFFLVLGNNGLCNQCGSIGCQCVL